MLAGAPLPPSPAPDRTPTRASCLLPRARSRSSGRVVQQRDPRPGEHVYTVAAQIDHAGLLHLTVDVRRGGDGTLRPGGYPALVGAPASAPVSRDPDERLGDIDDQRLSVVVARALRNYLGGDADRLSADLAPGARVELPAPRI